MSKFGMNSLNYGTLKILSNELKKIAIPVSVNTLARIAGIKNDGKGHFNYTLDALAFALEFRDFQHFKSIMQAKECALESSVEWPLSSFLFEYTKEATQNNDSNYLKKLSEYIERNGCSTSTALELGIAITKGLRNNPNATKITPLLTGLPIYLDICFETYVDIDFLEGYYGDVILEVAKKENLNSRNWLFSNCLAFLVEMKRKLIKSSRKRGECLMQVQFDTLQDLLLKNTPYPVARWIGAIIEFSAMTKQENRIRPIMNWFFEQTEQMSADQLILFLSVISDNYSIISINERQQVLKLFQKIKSDVQFEKDSLYNAGLNFTIYEKKQMIRLENVIYDLKNQHPQLFTSRLTLKKKLALINPSLELIL